MRVLIIDDDPDTVSDINRFLPARFQCDSATNGEAGLELFTRALDKSNPYHLVILDIIMPRMNGEEVLKSIRDEERRHGRGNEQWSKVIMVSTLNSTAAISDTFNGGCDAYVVKPVRQETLLQRIQDLGLLSHAEFED